MNNVIPITSRPVESAPVPTVNLRHLHKAVESKQEFANWVKARLTESMAEEGRDYLVDKSIKQVPHQGGRRNSASLDYFATLDTAKHIAMLERNDKGREVRAYFIEAEKRLAAASLVARPMNAVQVARIQLAEALRAEASGAVLGMILPANNYGARARNGRQKLGLRRAAFVARKCRRAAAQDFVAKLEEIDAIEEQMELALMEVAS